jgi:hypothetical protein
MKMLYGEHWDPNREPCFSPDLKGDSPADPNFLKLPLFGLFVKAVFTLPISSAIVEMLFSRSAHAAPPTHGATVTLLLSVGVGRGWGGSYAYVRGKSRSAMKDGTAASILLTSELENLKPGGPYNRICDVLTDSGCRDRAMLVLGSNTAKHAVLTALLDPSTHF